MMNNEEIKELVKKEIRTSIEDIESRYGLENIHGYSLGTDDDARTLFHSICTREWVNEQRAKQGYEGVGHIFVEWVQPLNENLFGSISKILNSEADKWAFRWAKKRDSRFEVLCAALEEVAAEGVFGKDIFLFVGSTDPSPHMEKLSAKFVETHNSEENRQAYRLAIGC